MIADSTDRHQQNYNNADDHRQYHESLFDRKYTLYIEFRKWRYLLRSLQKAFMSKSTLLHLALNFLVQVLYTHQMRTGEKGILD
jgi:hypothetical protein